jgi:hypothetical protein
MEHCILLLRTLSSVWTQYAMFVLPNFLRQEANSCPKNTAAKEFLIINLIKCRTRTASSSHFTAMGDP